MVKPFLRSGQRSDYLPLGENGQTVFDSALQIREALRLQGFHDAANCLAIPQCHSDSDRIDWYAPRHGTLTSWTHISHPQRLHLISYLQERHAELDAFRLRCGSAENISLRLFASLLKHVLQFPGVQHIWLLDDKPVIEFWGFSSLPLHSDARMLDIILREEEERQQQLTLSAEQAEQSELSDDQTADEHPGEPDSEESPPLVVSLSQTCNVPDEEPVKTAEPETRKKRRFPVKYAVLAVLLIAGATVLSLPVFYTPSENKNSGTELRPAEPEQQTEQPEKAPQPLLSEVIESTLSTVMKTISSAKPVDNVVTAPAAPEPEALPPEPAAPEILPAEPVQDKDTLVLFPNSVRAGSVKFLNGNWQAVFFGETAKPETYPSVRLQIMNGKGHIHLNDGNKSCQAPVSAGLLPSGTLSVKSRTLRARCNDGSQQTIPDISCKQGTDSVAICQAKWSDNESSQLTFKKIMDK